MRKIVVLNNPGQYRLETHKSTFFELNEVISVCGSSFSVYDQWLHARVFLRLRLPPNDLLLDYALALFGMSVQEHAAAGCGDGAHEGNVPGLLLSNVAGQLKTGIDNGIQKRAVVGDDGRRSLSVVIRLPVRS